MGLPPGSDHHGHGDRKYGNDEDPKQTDRTTHSVCPSHLQRQFNELILVRVADFREGREDLREKKEL